jgi:hypothetical protein
LKTKELSFAQAQKSSEECEKTEVRGWKFEVGRENWNVPPIPPGICMDIKRNELLEGQFVSV